MVRVNTSYLPKYFKLLDLGDFQSGTSSVQFFPHKATLKKGTWGPFLPTKKRDFRDQFIIKIGTNYKKRTHYNTLRGN